MNAAKKMFDAASTVMWRAIASVSPVSRGSPPKALPLFAPEGRPEAFAT
jgi:hypothetical protein